jgi:ubiquinone biosynthesis protein COQ9
LQNNNLQDVVDYMFAWADVLESELLSSIDLKIQEGLESISELVSFRLDTTEQ